MGNVQAASNVYDPAIVLKEELLRLPVWGWYAKRLGMIPIDRGGRTKTLTRMMRKPRGKPASTDGKSSFSPAGHPPPPGVRKPYKVGVAVFLYQELSVTHRSDGPELRFVLGLKEVSSRNPA